MFNDYVLIGPKNDPANTNKKIIKTALTRLKTKSTFISRVMKLN